MNKSNPKSWFQRITADKKKFWISSGVTISIALFAWMFTYWGSHGLGDSARIPIGKGYAIENINWMEYGYIEEIKTSDGRKLEMTKFNVKNGKLIGNLDSWFDSFNNQYFALDLNSGNLLEFKNRSELDAYAELHKLPNSDELKSFESNYRSYWSGWRFWLLP